MKPSVYMSFVDRDKPEGQRWLGGCVVYANDLKEAMTEAWRLGCNPGGEVLGMIIKYYPDEKWYNRILTKEEVDAMDEEVRKARRS